jgi:hypothetical protein
LTVARVATVDDDPAVRADATIAHERIWAAIERGASC